MISRDTPSSSTATPKLLIFAISLTPMMLMIVANTTSPSARMMAFCAPPGVDVRPASSVPPTSWNAVETCGRMIWYATATAAAVTIAPMIMIQPASHDVAGLAICLDHWYTEPASGNCPPARRSTAPRRLGR